MWPVVLSPMEVHELLIQSPSIEVQIGDEEKEMKEECDLIIQKAGSVQS